MKRKHQQEFEDTITGIKNGSDIKTIIMRAVPGAGKSMIPMQACELIKAGLADRLCWIVPRLTLQDQAERNFVDPFFRELLDHKFIIRSSTNDDNPARGLDGFSTTYQAVGMDNNTVLFDFHRHRYILVLDEFHHIEKDGIWHKSIQPLIDKSEYVILMTGTMARGDSKRIAFIDYDLTGMPIIESTEKTAVINYTRKDALQEKAILPLIFNLSDAKAAWINKDGRHCQVASLATARADLTAQAIFTVLNSEFAEQLLNKSINHWTNYKSKHPRSKILIVTSDFKAAKKVIKYLSKYGYVSKIATSHDGTAAIKAIHEFKNGKLDILVGIAMFYEGFDCPQATHVCCLTNIRSIPWIEQMVARVVRIDSHAGPYHKQFGYIFAPDDKLLRSIVDYFRSEQMKCCPANDAQMELFEREAGDGGGQRIQIRPLESSMLGGREIDLVQRKLFEEKTPTDLEDELRKKIDDHVKSYAYWGRYRESKLNHDIKGIFGRARALMDIRELKAVWVWVQANYDLKNVRGCKIRVPRKAVRWYG